MLKPHKIPYLDTSKLSDELRPQMDDYLSRTDTWTALTVGKDAKTSKGEKLGVRTAIVYFVSYTLSGQNVCPMAELAACHEPCLGTAGRGAMHSVQHSRMARTLIFQQRPDIFYSRFHRQLVKHCKDCIRDGVIPAVRPNGTSDTRWENDPFFMAMLESLVREFGLRVYDYTKIPNRKNVPDWYDLTFSYSGVRGFQPFVQRAIDAGERIAVVFRNRAMVERLLEIGGSFLGLPVVDGDDTDVRFLDPKGAVVALYAKGKARHDKSGFVVDLLV